MAWALPARSPLAPPSRRAHKGMMAQVPQQNAYLARRAEIEAPPDPADYSAFVRLASSPENRLIVSFGGGATPGLCGNLALARLLEELNLRPHIAEVWGTSAGAVIGGGWATGSDALDVLRLVQGL